MMLSAELNRIEKLWPFQLSVPSSFEPRRMIGRGWSFRMATSVTMRAFAAFVAHDQNPFARDPLAVMQALTSSS